MKAFTKISQIYTLLDGDIGNVFLSTKMLQKSVTCRDYEIFLDMSRFLNLLSYLSLASTRAGDLMHQGGPEAVLSPQTHSLLSTHTFFLLHHLCSHWSQNPICVSFPSGSLPLSYSDIAAMYGSPPTSFLLSLLRCG